MGRVRPNGVTRHGDRTRNGGGPAVTLAGMRAAQDFPASPTSPRDARHFIAGVLAEWGHSDAVDAARLLVTEVVTNAVLHARSAVTVEVRDVPGGVRVSVADASPVLPAPRDYSVQATTGRGLQLVASMATRWGVEPHHGGKVVWFVVARDAGTGAAAGRGSRIAGQAAYR